MNRRPAPQSSPKPQPVPIRPLLNRALVGAFAALVVARSLVSGDDPGRLRLTSGGGSVSFTLCLFLVLIGFTVWQVALGRGRPARWAIVPILLAGVGIAAFASSRLGDRYARPGLFIGWEWVGLAVAAYLARRLTGSANDSRGVLNVLIAAAVSIGGLSLYQAAADQAGWANTDVVTNVERVTLAGDDEFYPELNRPLDPLKYPHGTFDSPETLFVFLLLVLPSALAVAKFRRTSPLGRWAVVIPLVLIAASVATLLTNPFSSVRGHWSDALALLGDHLWLGIGPGNFSRHGAGVLGPQSAWFGLAATTGLIGVVLFLAAVVVAIRAARPSTQPEAWEPPVTATRWEFYLGGMWGLIIGFVWEFGAMPAEAPAIEVYRLGFIAVIRSILWFASFAVLESIRPTRKALGKAVLIGAGLVLFYGLVSDAPGRPTILFPLFVLLAIGANLRLPQVADIPDGGWTKPMRVAGVIVAAGIAITHLVTAGLPAWATADAVHRARMSSRLYPDLHRSIETARPGADQATAVTKARSFLLQNIIGPLREAAERDSNNAALLLELSRWRRPLWEYQMLAKDHENAAHVAEDTLRAADRAGKLDPHNPAAQRSLFEALALFRKNSNTRATERVTQLNRRIELIAAREPTLEVPLRLRVVQMLLDLKESDELLQPEITRLFMLNRTEGHGRLTDVQKKEVIDKAKNVMIDLPQALLDEWSK